MPEKSLSRLLAAPSVWQAEWQCKTVHSTQLPFESDVVVIGAGLGGLSAALHALNYGCSVTVLEAQQIGAGASGRNSGFVVPIPSRQTPNSLSKYLGDGTGHFTRALQHACGDLLSCSIAMPNQSGWMQPYANHCEQKMLAVANGWRNLGITVEVADCERMQNDLGTLHYRGGLCFPEGGVINPFALVQAMANQVTSRGGVIVEGCPVLQVNPYATYVGIFTPLGELKGNRVLVAGNAYGTHASRMTRQAVSQMTLILATFAMPEDWLELGAMPFSDNRIDMWFFRKLEKSRVLTGCFATPLTQSTDQYCSLLTERLHTIYASLPLELEHIWAGRVGLTCSATPVVNCLDKRIISWSGCNGRGLALSTLMGRTLVDRLLGQDGHRLAFPSSRYRHKYDALGWLAHTLIAMDRYKQRHFASARVTRPTPPGVSR
ncbi:MAG: NAD(P)/FAD-dependent oxidoreductase [Pseudomonas sp.]|uniref:NAD(P)/FAD-dependent oxidoreductase n=1 Tax=Pseudomonas sp. TaxID=306 RepID=UPI003D6DDC75